MRHCLQLIVHSLENDEMAGGSDGTDRTGVREHVRPALTRAEEVVANASGENFPVALRLLPARHRRHLTNLYFFARLTDDHAGGRSDQPSRRLRPRPADRPRPDRSRARRSTQQINCARGVRARRACARRARRVRSPRPARPSTRRRAGEIPEPRKN